MTWRVYVTYNNTGTQIKTRAASLAFAISQILPKLPSDRDTVREMLMALRPLIACKPAVPVVTRLTGDLRICVEIFR